MSEADNAPTQSDDSGSADDTSFDAEFQAFLGHTFGPDTEDLPPTDSGEGNTDEPAPAGDAPVIPDAAAQAPNAEPTAGSTPDAAVPPDSGQPATAAPAADGEVDQALLAVMLGVSEAPKAGEQPAPKAGEPAPATSSTPTDDEDFAPFTPDFRLKPEVTSALFESEDTETREKALVGLLAAMANTITSVMDQRIRQHHAPRLQESFTSATEQRNVLQAVNQDFVTAYPELAPYGAAVKKAFQVVGQQDPQAPYSPEMRDKVGRLARAAVMASGIQLPARGAPAPAPAAAVTPTPAKAAPKGGTPFEAGAARPGGTGVSVDSGPGALLDELSEFS